MSDDRLVLFDIDGTLLSTNGHGVRALHEAFQAVWGRPTADVPYRMSGKTELQIVHELMALVGVSREEVEAGLEAFWEAYPDALARLLTPADVALKPGVREVVAAVGERAGWVPGLLTGNCEAAARIKLERGGLDGFRVGAFGQAHEARADLPALAVAQARERLGRTFSGKQVVVIGDTPNDIHCGQAHGARTIAVATGRFDARAELAAHEPDYLFDDLADLRGVLAAIEAPA